MSSQNFQAPESVQRLQQRALVAGLIGVVGCIIGLIKSPEDFFHSYLFAFLFVLGLSLGSLGLLMLHHLTSGLWGIVIRRTLEAASRTLALVFVLFLPILFGMKYIYSVWLNAPATGEEALNHFQQTYLTKQWFTVRGLIYFAVWGLLVWLLTTWSKRQDVDTQDRLLRRHFKLLSGPGIILYVFGIGFASIDWAMSLSPHWFSTIYGFIFVAGQLISSMALAISILVMLAQTAPLAGVIKPRHLHDLGKLLFAFVMLWAYFSFSQLLIIWSGNQPEEITFFMKRLHGNFGVIGVIILILHFFVPFFLLLSRDLKRDASMLPKVALWLMLMRLVDLFWYTRPEFTTTAWPTVWDFAAPLALVGLWVYFFAGQLKRMPLLPLGEPKLPEVTAQYEH
jgi:hypothetical protein